MDTTLFKHTYKNDLLIVQIYINDNIFFATNEDICNEFSDLMKGKLEMSLMGELRFFFGSQIKQSENGIFIHQEIYAKDLLRKFKMEDPKRIGTAMHPSMVIDKVEKGKLVSEKEYRAMIGSLLYLLHLNLILYFQLVSMQDFSLL